MKKILVGRMVAAVILIVAYLVMAGLEFHHLEAGPVFFVLVALVMFVPLPGAKAQKPQGIEENTERKVA
ncbi:MULTISPECIES: hypothetical protein [unclassified Corynebacterium]|uniref:hypothetical protein n=1 Tax=unclassified Corynebacterium TaxID=2624378 RepID=UPI0029CA9284|nr:MULTISPECIES: hypothetical protein [unclassified Corynebacterium]WPF65460.1 hypothetical protein OLX12_07705 [Corynebacterium sp. 22KM0430]WPF67956.1 hypothetical protein OLW90_07700 [Corynebacterium sp. 21KM1197]